MRGSARARARRWRTGWRRAASRVRPRHPASAPGPRPLSAQPSPKWTQPSWPPAWPPPTVSSRRSDRVADARPRSRRRSRPVRPRLRRAARASQSPIGAGVAGVARPDVPPEPHGLAVVDLDQVEQAVEIEVGQRGAAALGRSSTIPASSAPSMNVPSGWPSSRLLGSFCGVVGHARRRCPWR